MDTSKTESVACSIRDFQQQGCRLASDARDAPLTVGSVGRTTPWIDVALKCHVTTESYGAGHHFEQAQ